MKDDFNDILDSLLLHNENEVVEFKEAKDTFRTDDLGKYFSALSNEANLRQMNYAWLVLGIKDKTKAIVGTNYKDSDKSIQALKHDIAQHTTDNHTFFNIQPVIKEGKRVLIFQILPAPKGIPLSWKDIRYGRNGESLVVLSDAKIDKIRNQTLNEDWSANIIKNASIDDLDPLAIARARENYKAKHSSLEEQIKTWDDATFLNKAKITIRGQITNAAIVLLGKEESEVLISPSVAKMRWILKDADGTNRDYRIKSCPFLLAVDEIFRLIRNLKYRYINPYFNTLFPEELDTYDSYVIREAINNAIAHQDYLLGGMINVVELNDRLIFSNQGSFLPESVKEVIKADAPEEKYRNNFLAQAMVELNMVDTIGSGIRKMFLSQYKRLFPMPNYDLYRDRVQVTIVGHVLNTNFSMLLAQHRNLDLCEIEMLNRVLFKKDLSSEEILHLRKKKLIEGRKPNIYLAKSVAAATNRKVEYTKNKGFDDPYYKDYIVRALGQHHGMSRQDINKLLLDKLPAVLKEQQKLNKVKNLLLSLRSDGIIRYLSTDKIWVLC